MRCHRVDVLRLLPIPQLVPTGSQGRAAIDIIDPHIVSRTRASFATIRDIIFSALCFGLDIVDAWAGSLTHKDNHQHVVFSTNSSHHTTSNSLASLILLLILYGHPPYQREHQSKAFTITHLTCLRPPFDFAVPFPQAIKPPTIDILGICYPKTPPDVCPFRIGSIRKRIQFIWPVEIEF